MPRKLKTFTTSVGFFDLAISAPSMKAALEAWGAGPHLFHHGFAREVDDPWIVRATMAKPGVVLRRPVGTNDPFTEHAEVSTAVPLRKVKVPQPRRSPKTVNLPDDEVSLKAAGAYEKERLRQQRQSRKQAAALEKEGERRDRAIAAAEAALTEAEQSHERIVQQLEKAKAALDRKSAGEAARWSKVQDKLQEALRQARKPRHLKLL
jgi:colicin import membrane protein